LCVPPHLPPDDGGRLIVIGAGKASAAMARAVEEHWSGPLDGLVVTRYGHGVPCERIEIVEAAHPVPDAAGEAAALRILGKVQGLTAGDRVLALISGGGSALLAAPAAGITLAEKQALTAALLKSGASIGEMNCVRKHLSAIKGGRLAAPPGRRGADAGDFRRAGRRSGGDRLRPDGRRPDDCGRRAESARFLRHRHSRRCAPGCFRRTGNAEAGRPASGEKRIPPGRQPAPDARSGGGRSARRRGITPLILGDAIEGEAREVGKALAGMAVLRSTRFSGQKAGACCCPAARRR
jgi:glycerate 2-kinase